MTKQLLTVPPYMGELWNQLRQLPTGTWSYVPASEKSPGLGRYVVKAGDTGLIRVSRLIDNETTEKVLTLVMALRNAMPQIVIDMSQLIGVRRILAVTREITDDGEAQASNDVEFAAQLSEALEAFRRAETVVPREKGERMTAWVERVVYRLLILEKLAHDGGETPSSGR